MGLTIAEKILARACGKTSCTFGEVVEVTIDATMLHDIGAPGIQRPLQELGVKTIVPSIKVVIIPGHFVPASTVKAAGIGAIIAQSFARTFFRNAINIGLPVVEMKEQRGFIDEQDEIEVDVDQGRMKNLTKDKESTFPPLPQFIRGILKAGGAVPYYKDRIKSREETV